MIFLFQKFAKNEFGTTKVQLCQIFKLCWKIFRFNFIMLNYKYKIGAGGP